jgi:hypothetical protein
MMVNNVWLILGIVNIVLIMIATFVIVYNKRMTSNGKMLRILEIIILPVLGPIFTLIEVLYRVKEEKNKNKNGV